MPLTAQSFLYPMRREDLVAAFAYFERPGIYLEIGCGGGHTIAQVAPWCRRALGVDILDRRAPECRNFEAFFAPSADFLRNSLPGILGGELTSMVYIDGDHSFNAVLDDVNLSWPLLRDQGLMILHDTYPRHVGLTGPMPYGEPGEWEGDGYLIADLIRKGELLKGEAEIVTIPSTSHSIIRKTRKQVPWQR